MEASQGRAPCGSCGAVNVPPPAVVNPYGPQMSQMAPGAWSAELRSCRACRLDNPPENKICRACGALMPTGEMLVMPTQPAAHAWGCPQCRAENAAHYEFCLGCGASRRAAGDGGASAERRNVYNGNPAISPQPQKSPVVLIIVIVVVVLIIVGAALAGVAAMFLVR